MCECAVLFLSFSASSLCVLWLFIINARLREFITLLHWLRTKLLSLRSLLFRKQNKRWKKSLYGCALLCAPISFFCADGRAIDLRSLHFLRWCMERPRAQHSIHDVDAARSALFCGNKYNTPLELDLCDRVFEPRTTLKDEICWLTLSLWRAEKISIRFETSSGILQQWI